MNFNTIVCEFQYHVHLKVPQNYHLIPPQYFLWDNITLVYVQKPGFTMVYVKKHDVVVIARHQAPKNMENYGTKYKSVLIVTCLECQNATVLPCFMSKIRW